MHGQVEADGLVHDLGIANLGNGVQEEIVVPSRRTLHHYLDGIVVLLVGHVQVHSRGEQTRSFAGTDNLANVKLAEEHLAMLHDLVRNVLGVQNTKLSKDTNVSILKAKTLLKERNKVGKVSKIRVVRNNFVNMIGVLDNLETARSSKAELFGAEAGKAHMPSK